MKTHTVTYWFSGMTSFLKLADPIDHITEKGSVCAGIFDCFYRNSYTTVDFIVILQPLKWHQSLHGYDCSRLKEAFSL